MRERERLITVCDKCFCAGCWHGEIMCFDAQSAGTVQKSESQLKALAVEHPSAYSREKVERVCGSTVYVPL